MIHPNMLYGIDTKKWKIGTYRLASDLCWSQKIQEVEVISTVPPKSRRKVSFGTGVFWSEDQFQEGDDVILVLDCVESRETPVPRVRFIGSECFCKPFFNGRSMLEAADALRKMLSLPPAAQIAACGHIQADVTYNEEAIFHSNLQSMDSGDLRNLFEIVEPNLLPDQRTACRRWLAAPMRSHGKEKAAWILSCRPTAGGIRKEITYEHIMEIFNREVEGCEDMKEAIANSLVNTVCKKGRGIRVFIHGLPGTGKSSWGSVIAKVLERPLKQVNLGGISSTVSTLGCEASYENSEPGIFLKFLSENGAESVIVCDEMDKLAKAGTARGKDGEVMESLLKMFDPERPYLYDAFVDGVPVDMSHTIFVVTANRIDNIPPEMLSRFDHVFCMEPYSEEVLLKILRCHADRLAEDYGLPSGWVLEAGFRELLRYRKDFGARDAIAHLRTLAAGWTKPVTAAVVSHEIRKLVDIEDAAVRYHLHEAEYPEKQKKTILDLFSRRLSAENLSAQEKRSLDLRLEYLTKLVPEHKYTFDVDRYRQTVDRKLYGMQNVKEELAAELYAASVSDSCPKPLLLAGPAGVGKSSFAEAIAECCGRKYIRLQMNGVSDPDFLKGTGREKVAADAGQLVRNMAYAGTTGPVLYFDEIEKVADRCAMAMLDIFDDSRKFYDQFLDIEIDLSGAVLIASCNNLSAMDQVLRSRFTIIQVPGYTATEKRVIAKEYLLPTLNTDINLNQQALEAVLRRYECDAGIRSVKHGLQTVIKQRQLESRNDEGTVLVNEADVERILGRKAYVYTADRAPGCVNSLAVAGDATGLVSPIRVTMLHSGVRRVTGMAEEPIRDSIAVAETWLEERFGICMDGGFHLHFGPPASVKKSGPSAGVAIAMAMLSAATGHDISHAAFTGEFDGVRVLPVGGVFLKVQAAKSAGLRVVYVPEANQNDVGLDQFADMDIVFVNNIEEVVNSLMPRAQIHSIANDHARRAG